jgi:hypothetical protein
VPGAEFNRQLPKAFDVILRHNECQPAQPVRPREWGGVPTLAHQQAPKRSSTKEPLHQFSRPPNRTETRCRFRQLCAQTTADEKRFKLFTFTRGRVQVEDSISVLTLSITVVSPDRRSQTRPRGSVPYVRRQSVGLSVIGRRSTRRALAGASF